MMTDENRNYKETNCRYLKTLSQEELELEVDSLLAKCRTEVEVKSTAERGAMFKKGPFQISISLAVKMKNYQDELLNCRRNPYDVLLSVCSDNGWGAPEFRAIDYIPGEGFLFSVVVNDHELLSKWRDRRPLIAADLAAANFLRYLGLWVNVKNLNLFFDWEQITPDNLGGNSEIGNINGYLYFMGFNVVKSESTGGDKNWSSVLSLKPNIHLQLAKLMYVILTSRGEKTCWLTDIDIAYFKQIFGDLEPDASYAFHNTSWTANMLCSCENKESRVCFTHEKFFLYFLLKDYFYIDKFGPVDLSIFEKLSEMKKEIIKSETDEAAQESKALVFKEIFEKLKHLKNENDDAANDSKATLKETKAIIQEYLEELKSVNQVEDNLTGRNIHPAHSSKETEIFSNINKVSNPVRKQPTSSVEFDPTETPVNLRETKFDLRSKIFGKEKDEHKVKEEKIDFKVSFDYVTGRSNIKSAEGNWITVADIRPPQVPTPTGSNKRPCNITVVTTKRKKKK